MIEQLQAEAVRLLCTASASNVVGTKSERSISARIRHARYMHIGRAPELHRERLRVSQSRQNRKTQRMRAMGWAMANDNAKPYWIHETTVQQNDRLVLSKKMLRSKAFVRLTGSAKQILIELYTRLKLEKYKTRKPNRNSDRFYAVNNGELVLTYKSIHKQFGYSTATISKAIDRLASHGFIDIAELGCGVKRQSHKIALIKNWQDYGTENFRPGIGKPKTGPVNRGFKKKKQAVNLETTSGTKEGTTTGTKAVQCEKQSKPP